MAPHHRVAGETQTSPSQTTWTLTGVPQLQTITSENHINSEKDSPPTSSLSPHKKPSLLRLRTKCLLSARGSSEEPLCGGR